ncbi:MAG TPA: EFR1 family ferrodoxin [Candidatus Ozemobacteraceae bacterium]|nr:EFR1 family ferrodoxin [Candidatus Ozemobacteraceae bacterium]
MKFKRVCLCYFSPTGATRTITSEIAAGIGIDPLKVIENNLTYPEYADSIIEIEPDDLVVIAAPVYAGMLPAVALQRLNTIKFAGNPAVLVAVYGNRNYDDALIDLREFASGAGLLPVAAAAFVGEHSYSNDKYKIAKGRPDADDKEAARDFGRKIYEKVQSLSPKSAMPELKLPGTFPLPERKNINHTAVETRHEICTECGRCQEVCPTGAVYFKKGYQTKKELCILCCACVKKCPQQARIAASETLQQFREKLSAMPRRNPEIFF